MSNRQEDTMQTPMTREDRTEQLAAWMLKQPGENRPATEVYDEAAVRVRAFREGRTLDELGRGFFEAYGGLAAGGIPDGATDRGAEPQAPGGPVAEAAARPAPAASPSFKPDPKGGKK